MFINSIAFSYQNFSNLFFMVYDLLFVSLFNTLLKYVFDNQQVYIFSDCGMRGKNLMKMIYKSYLKFLFNRFFFNY